VNYCTSEIARYVEAGAVLASLINHYIIGIMEARLCPLQSSCKAMCDKGHLFRVLLTYVTRQFVNSCLIEKIDGVLNKVQKIKRGVLASTYDACLPENA
jgi:hypothetical protein